MTTTDWKKGKARREMAFWRWVPELSDEEHRLLKANKLGFQGFSDSYRDIARLELRPTLLGSEYWWLSYTYGPPVFDECYSPRPFPTRFMPVDKWRHLKLSPCRMEPSGECPYTEKEPEPKPERTNIYFIQSDMGGPVKVGCANDVETRLRALQKYSPFKLRVRHVIEKVPVKKERELHVRFAKYRLHGEWFSEEILAAYHTTKGRTAE
jgi:hypothetical protein